MNLSTNCVLGEYRLRNSFGRILLLIVCVLSSACGVGNSRVPLGTWKDVATDRYITIEADTANHNNAQLANAGSASQRFAKQQYQALLFSVHHTDATSTKASEKIVIRERSLPATMEQGVLMLQAGAVDIAVLYHPSEELLLVNGVTEFRRVPEELAQTTLAKLQDPS